MRPYHETIDICENARVKFKKSSTFMKTPRLNMKTW